MIGTQVTQWDPIRTDDILSEIQCFLYFQVQTGRRYRRMVKSSALLRRHPGPTSVRNRVSLQGRLRPLLHQPRHPVLLSQSFRGLPAEADVTLCLVTLQKHTQWPADVVRCPCTPPLLPARPNWSRQVCSETHSQVYILEKIILPFI